MNHNTDPRVESSHSAADAPLKIKVYGILPMTRNAYLITQVVLYVATVLLLLALKPALTNVRVLAIVFDHFVLFLIVVALLELGETFFMLRRFKAKQQQLAISSEEETTSQT